MAIWKYLDTILLEKITYLEEEEIVITTETRHLLKLLG